MWYVGSQDKIRFLWRHYEHRADRLIINSNDRDRIEDGKEYCRRWSTLTRQFACISRIGTRGHTETGFNVVGCGADAIWRIDGGEIWVFLFSTVANVVVVLHR